MNKKSKNPFKDLTKFELTLWLASVCIILISFLYLKNGTYISLIASLIGVTALIFIAKGYVIGQLLLIVFAVLYGIVSYEQRYYGEMITYLGMSAPIALFSAISWLKHPYKDTKEVQVNKLSLKQKISVPVLAIIVTTAFYFILKKMGNASLIVSTVSVTTSFIAAYLTFLRNPHYALGYAANDIVLIILWTISTVKDISCLSMLICFVVFFANDMYGFFNWKRMQKRQNS